jgi:hypothetical protein
MKSRDAPIDKRQRTDQLTSVRRYTELDGSSSISNNNSREVTLQGGFSSAISAMRASGGATVNKEDNVNIEVIAEVVATDNDVDCYHSDEDIDVTILLNVPEDPDQIQPSSQHGED